MWTRETVKDRVNQLNFKPYYTRTELKNLHNILHPNESIIAIMEGELKKIHNKKQTGWGIVLLTDKRIIFYRKSIIGTVTNEEIPFKQISSTSFRKGILQSSMHVYTANNESEVMTPDKKSCENFTLTFQKMLHSPEVQENAVGATNIDQLEKLFSLKEKGAITETEYERQKNILLTK